MVTTRPPKTIVKPTALGPVANTDTKLLIYGLFQKGRVLAQDGNSVCAAAAEADARTKNAPSTHRGRPGRWECTVMGCAFFTFVIVRA